MEKNGERFEVDLNGQRIIIQPALHEGRSMYEVKTPNKHFFLTQATAKKGTGKLWVSLPQGQQKLAEEIGELIELRQKGEQQNLF